MLKFFSIVSIVLLGNLYAKYCIQVSTVVATQQKSLIKNAQSSLFVPFDKVRVEQRGSYYVLRIGDYSQYKQARKDLHIISQVYDDAYIRRCDFNKNQAIYVKEDVNVLTVEKETIKPQAPKKVPQVQHSRRILDECQRCFTPLYEDESKKENDR